MSSKDNAIEIHSDSDDSSTKTGVQVDVNPEDYVQPDIPSRVLGIGDDEFACLTYEAKDIEIMKHPYFWIEQPHMASFIRVVPYKSPHVHFVELPLLPNITYKCEKLPASVKIYSRNMNTGNPETNPNGHWVHFSIYKDIQKIVIAEACAESKKLWRKDYSEVVKKLLNCIRWVKEDSKVLLVDKNIRGQTQWRGCQWFVDYHKFITADENIPSCGPFVMSASEYAYEGNSDWSKFFEYKQVAANRNEIFDRFKENLILYLNNLKQKDTSWNDEEFEYAMQVRDNLEGKVRKRSKMREDNAVEKVNTGKRNKY